MRYHFELSHTRLGDILHNWLNINQIKPLDILYICIKTCMSCSSLYGKKNPRWKNESNIEASKSIMNKLKCIPIVEHLVLIEKHKDPHNKILDLNHFSTLMLTSL